MVADVRLSWREPRQIETRCPLCGYEGAFAHFVRVIQDDALCTEEDSWYCPECMGFFAQPWKYPDYADDYGFPDYFRYYCEVGAGIGSMIEPVLCVASRKKIDTMLDVGCGVPFTVDFARTRLGVAASGVDPSTYARRGNELLAVPLDQGMLGHGSSSDGKQFDLVFSSEVIEHVEDPIAFARTLSEHTASEGVLVLTTPSAEFVVPGKSRLDCLGTIWPAIHHAIYSATGLEKLLRGLGFGYVTVRRQRERLLAFACRIPFEPGTPSLEDQAACRAYIAAQAEDPARFGRSLASGNLFRIFRDAVNEGKLDLAASIDERMREFCQSAYGCDLHEYERFCQEAKITEQDALFSRWPYFTYVYAYYASMLALLKGRYRNAETGFAAFCDMISHNRFRNALWWGEGANLYESALFHRGFAALLDGRRDEAIRSFKQVLARSGEPPLGLAAMVCRNDEIGLRALMQMGVCHLQSGNPVKAIAVFDEALEWAGKFATSQDRIGELIKLVHVAHEVRAAQAH